MSSCAAAGGSFTLACLCRQESPASFHITSVQPQGTALLRGPEEIRRIRVRLRSNELVEVPIAPHTVPVSSLICLLGVQTDELVAKAHLRQKQAALVPLTVSIPWIHTS